MTDSRPPVTSEQVLARADELQRQLGERFRDQLVESLYTEAQRIAGRAVKTSESSWASLDRRIDRVVTSRVLGLPIMLFMLAAVFWLTIVGSNVPSAFLAGLLMEEGGLSGWLSEYLGVEQAPAILSMSLYEVLHWLFAVVHMPSWLTGLLVDGVYLGLGWVVSVMLPPMAIFFPIWTILEDLGYLPRVAFNLDFLFKRAGAHGKQALTMAMGFGCNAAGVISCRVIDSPRERLIAILTNNFMICNGRFPTIIMLATIFVGAAFPPALVSIAAAGTVMAVVLLGVLFTLVVSYALSRTVLRGEQSAFALELPPYRRPAILRILRTSLIDRTLFVLMRAMATAAPAGAVIWILGNIDVAGKSLALHAVDLLGPLGYVMGLDGVILLAYVIAIPANEIVVPTMIMVYLGAGRMTDVESFSQLRTLLVDQHGWTLLTAVNLMLFSLLHNPCGTTIWTILRETGSRKWTIFGALMPVAIGVVVTSLVAAVVRMFF